MLYFSKLKVFSVLILTIILTYFAFSNFILIDDDFFKRKINLGLDLQGGSYLLLEVDNKPVVTRKLQSKVLELKKFFKDKNIQIKNVKINEDIINLLDAENIVYGSSVLNNPDPKKQIMRLQTVGRYEN